jgi:integrase
MMGRPPLPLGTWGKFRTRETPTGEWRAVAFYKDYDGVTRPVERVGPTLAKAENRLREALRDRARQSGEGIITADSTIGSTAELWLGELDNSEKATRTKREYRQTWERYLRAPLAQLRWRQVRVSIVNRVITDVRDKNGRSAAAMAKVVLSGICALAVRHDAIDENPVREIETVSKKRRTKTKRINKKTIGPIHELFRNSEDAKKADLVDLVEVLAGLGCRIGELLALDYETSVDFEAGTVWFHGTVVRITGQGLQVQDHTKSLKGMRTIRPPEWVMEILKRRAGEADSPWVFPSDSGGLRDPDSVRRVIRRLVSGTPYAGLHPHDWRHYVATVLDEAGLSARQIADYLGHEQVSTTWDDYMDRGIVGEGAGPALADKPGT